MDEGKQSEEDDSDDTIEASTTEDEDDEQISKNDNNVLLQKDQVLETNQDETSSITNQLSCLNIVSQHQNIERKSGKPKIIELD